MNTDRVFFVPIPHPVIDAALPKLKDTELRVLLVVLRQTLGWRDAHGRSKARDWLSHAQLVRRTGRKSEAVSKAIASLVQSGWLIVEDSAGNPLPTPQARRRHLGRLYFRVGENGVPNPKTPSTAKHPLPVRDVLVIHTPGWSRAGQVATARPAPPSGSGRK